MKKALRILVSVLVIAGMTAVLGTTTSCKSSKGEVMYKSHQDNTKTINKNYRIKGTNERNKQTYRSY